MFLLMENMMYDALSVLTLSNHKISLHLSCNLFMHI